MYVGVSVSVCRLIPVGLRPQLYCYPIVVVRSEDRGDISAMAMDNPSLSQRLNVASLTPTQTTLLITLLARVQDARRSKPIVHDKWAAGVLDKIEHAPSSLRGNHARETVLLRARQIDEWTTAFLADHSEATVLHLACGLDTRCRRVKWNAPGTNVRWIDVDFPDVVDLRKKVCEEPDGDYSLVSANVTGEEWLVQIPADRPTVVVFEGLTPYLTDETGSTLIRRLVGHFKTGELLFDTVGPLAVRMQSLFTPVQNVGASFTWAVKHPKVIERLHPRLKLRDCLHPWDANGFDNVPQSTRLTFTTYRSLPGFRSLNLNHRFRF